MAKVHPYNDGNGKQIGFMIFCHACKCGHGFLVKSGIPGRDWTFDGNMEKPTFNPSMLVRGTMYPSGGQMPNDDELAQLKAGKDFGPEMRPYICHSFVHNGKIQYLSDCTHKFANQTINLEDF